MSKTLEKVLATFNVLQTDSGEHLLSLDTGGGIHKLLCTLELLARPGGAMLVRVVQPKRLSQKRIRNCDRKKRAKK
jgi:hypothetical protein